MATEKEFQDAVQKSQQISKRQSNEDLLLLYALYKQATEGDVKGEKPGGFDIKAMAKYAAWSEQKGKPAVQVRQEYVQLVNRLQ